MNAIVDVLNKTEKIVRENSSSILTALGVSGTIGTAYLAGKASFKAARILEKEMPCSPTKDRVQRVWKLYIPTGVSATVTIGCILGSAKINSRRAAALTAAYSLSEKAFTEYKEKVIETLGEKKEQKVRDQIASDHISRNPPTQSVLMLGNGDVLCCELWTGRYFNSNMEKLRQGQNTINAKLISQMEATLSDFYWLVDLPSTSGSAYSGWTSDKMLDLSFTSLLHEGKPVLAFEYNYVRPI